MERYLILMIPPLWGALVLGLGYLAQGIRKKELRKGMGGLTTLTQRDVTEEAFY